MSVAYQNSCLKPDRFVSMHGRWEDPVDHWLVRSDLNVSTPYTTDFKSGNYNGSESATFKVPAKDVWQDMVKGRDDHMGDSGMVLCRQANYVSPFTRPTVQETIQAAGQEHWKLDWCPLSFFDTKLSRNVIHNISIIVVPETHVFSWNKTSCHFGSSISSMLCVLIRGETINKANLPYNRTLRGNYCVPSRSHLKFQRPVFVPLSMGPYPPNEPSLKRATDEHNCKLEEETEGFLIQCDSVGLKNVTITRASVIHREMTDHFTFEYPESWMRTSSHVFVQVFDSGKVIGFWHLETPVISECHHVNCFFCTKNLANFSCLSTQNQVATILVIVTLIIVTIGFSGMMTYMLWGSVCVCPKWEAIRQIDDQSTSKSGRTRKLSTGTACLLIMCLVSPSLACDQSFVLNSPQTQCFQQGSELNCELSMLTDVQLNNPGTKYCGVIMAGPFILASVNITYMSLQHHVQTTLKYYTSNFDYASTGAKKCKGTEYCTATKNCKTSLEEGSLDGGGVLQGPATVLPGHSACGDGCGCAGCNCPGCAESCVFSRWAINTYETFWGVHQVVSTQLFPIIEICMEYNNTRECYVKTIHNLHEHVAGPVQIVGLSASSSYADIIHHDVAINMEGNGGFYAPTAPIGSPVAGMIGEVQSNSLKALQVGDPYQVLVSQNLCEVSQSNSFPVFQCQLPAVRNYASWPQIPGFINNLYWDFHEDRVISAVDTRESSVSVRITAPANSTIKTIINEVCPVLHYEGVTQGCHNCAEGAEVKLLVSSACHAGNCFLSSQSISVSLSQVVLDLTTRPTFVWLRFSSQVKEGSFILTCTAGKQSTSIPIQFDLDEPHPIFISNDSHSKVLDTPNAFDSWFDGLSIGSKIGLIIGWIAGIATILLLFITLAFYAPTFIAWAGRKYRQRSRAMKREEKAKRSDRMNTEDSYVSSEESELGEMDTYHSLDRKNNLDHLRDDEIELAVSSSPYPISRIEYL